MTIPDPSPLDDAAEADVAEQLTPVDDVDDLEDGETWSDTQRVSEERDWQASEADLIEQSQAVPDDDAEFDR